MHHIPILVVEDDPDCAAGLCEALADAGHPSLWAASPAEALAAIGRDQRIGIVVLDLRLPELDGIQLLARLREAVGCRGGSLQGILSSGAATSSDIDGAMRSGVLAFVPKPVDRIALLNAVVDAAERYRARERDRLARASLAERCRQLEGTLTEVAQEVAELTFLPPRAPRASTDAVAPAPNLDRAWRELQCRRLQSEARQMDRLLGRLAIDGVEWRVLLALLEADLGPGEVPVTSIALACGTSPSAGLRRITALEARGFVERCGDPGDGRRALVRLTGPGRLICHDAIKSIAAWRAAA
ncbi:MAG TPA: response regulator [Stellaceae bacterium]|nr:response regulator [Stellaceae bacterium]